MADQFKVEVVSQRCEVFLTGCPMTLIPLEKKLVFAQDYRFTGLEVGGA
jgi:hypothetical protein